MGYFRLVLLLGGLTGLMLDINFHLIYGDYDVRSLENMSLSRWFLLSSKC